MNDPVGLPALPSSPTSTSADATPLPVTVVTAFSHVGLSVPDIGAAIRWYCDVLGFQLLEGPRLVDDSGPVATMAHDIYGAEWHAMRQAHLGSGNGVGLELFEFLRPAELPAVHHFDYRQPGVFHIAVTHPDVTGLAGRIAAAGGRQRTRVYTPQPGFSMCYCEDPWGNALEINSRSYDAAHPARPTP